MGSESALRLPIIDFTKLDEPGSSKWESVKAQVFQAAKEYGCFEAVYDVPIDLRSGIFSVAEDIFDLPTETKQRNVSEKPYHGYAGQYDLVPLYESLGIDDANDAANIDNFVHTLWPEGKSNNSKPLQTFTGYVTQLDQIVRTMIVESLGLQKYLFEHIGSTSYLLRFQKYIGPKTTEPKLGLHSHTDKNTTTILYNNQVEGLEVQTPDGEWIKIKPSPNCFIYMVGEAFIAWTNGRLHPVYHRVMMTGDVPRYSIGLFAVPRPSYMVKAPEEMVDKEHPLLFKPYDHIEFLKFYYTEEGRKAKSAMKLYCGI